MEFYIRQGSTEPILKLKLIDDGKNDKSYFNDLLENSTITFDMFDVNTEIPVILNAECNITTRKKLFNNTTNEYYIIYRFTQENTSVKGRFEGIVTINFLNELSEITNILKVPIKEKLYINII